MIMTVNLKEQELELQTSLRITSNKIKSLNEN